MDERDYCVDSTLLPRLNDDGNCGNWNGMEWKESKFHDLLFLIEREFDFTVDMYISQVLNLKF